MPQRCIGSRDTPTCNTGADVDTSIRFDSLQFGVIRLEELERAITDDTKLVSIMHANNEVGTLQPLADISRICRARNPRILIHTDAAQSIGKVRVCLHLSVVLQRP
jgi:cysteine sulfinate desulfinase/cysteine desulfurase-like protein